MLTAKETINAVLQQREEQMLNFANMKTEKEQKTKGTNHKAEFLLMVIFLQDIKDHHQCLITLKPVYMNLHTMLQDSSGYIYCQQRNKNATYCRVISITAITLWLFVKNKIK